MLALQGRRKIRPAFAGRAGSHRAHDLSRCANGLIRRSLSAGATLFTIGTASVRFKYADTLLLVVVTTAFAAAAAALWILLEAASIVPISVLLLACIFALLRHQFRVRERQDADQLRQIQALLTLYKLIPFRASPPWFVGWAATPEFAVTIYDLVRDRKPRLVLELGSGASSVVLAAALDQNGRGRLVSIEQDAHYAERTRAALDLQGWSNVADIVHAPIADVTIVRTPWKWYDPTALTDLDQIDMLIVDGPHRELQRLARYPALPMLFDRLSPDAVIVVDDANRKDERAAIERWTAEFDGLSVAVLESPKGTAILERSTAVSSGVPAGRQPQTQWAE